MKTAVIILVIAIGILIGVGIWLFRWANKKHKQEKDLRDWFKRMNPGKFGDKDKK